MEKVDEVEGIEVVKQIKYLGVKVEDKRELYDGHRMGMIEKVKKMSNSYGILSNREELL